MVREKEPQTALALYFHQPWVVDDSDILDVVRESLDPLLDVHARQKVPVTLALTGALLERLVDLSPDTVAATKQLHDAGIVEIAGTFHHEVFPHFLDIDQLTAQLQRDVDLKFDLFGHKVETFFPANFAWTPALVPILKGFGIKRALLDGEHLKLAGAMQFWKWNAFGPEAPLHEAALPRNSCNHIWTLHGEYGPSIDLLFRDLQRVKAFSFGDVGGIHRPLDSEARRIAAEALSIEDGIVVIADDGDRVNSISIDPYRELITSGTTIFRCVKDLTDRLPRRLDYLAGFSLGDIEKFWLSGPENRHWLRVLDSVHRRYTNPNNPAVLSLHDVYPFFWRTHWRTRKFWEKAHEIMNQTDSSAELLTLRNS